MPSSCTSRARDDTVLTTSAAAVGATMGMAAAEVPPKREGRLVHILGVAVGRVDDARLADWREERVTYDHVGSTVDPASWPSRRQTTVHRHLGRGPDVFAAAAAALRSWAPQRRVGARVEPAGVRPDLDEVAVVAIGVGPVRLLAPTRVVAVVDEPDRAGFAYGSLPGHPESGEECFLVEQLADGAVRGTIRVDAVPSRGVRVLAPIVHLGQRAALSRYLGALTRATAGVGAP
jgi:uncharacterized protein (UPF0548 family)